VRLQASFNGIERVRNIAYHMIVVSTSSGDGRLVSKQTASIRAIVTGTDQIAKEILLVRGAGFWTVDVADVPRAPRIPGKPKMAPAK
jgi:hypothetical protein